MKCNICGENYELQGIALRDLRNKIIKQEKIEDLDIIAGYRAKSEVELFKNFTIKDDNINGWMDDFKKIKSEKEEKVNKKKEEMEKEAEEEHNNDIFIGPKKKAYYSIDWNEEKMLLEEELKPFYEKYGDNYFIDHKYYHFSSKPINLDFYLSKINLRDINIGLNSGKNISELLNLTSPKYCVKIESYKEDENLEEKYFWEDYAIYKIISREEALSIVEKEINTYLNKKRTIDERIFAQQIEFSPIIINVTSNNKIQLLDGYKRVFFINDEELLNKIVPVKIFDNISDESFIKLLDMANAWKTLYTEYYKEANYYDRGYLFALRQRFGLKYEDYSYMDLTDLLKLYKKPYDYYKYNKYLIDDILDMKNINKLPEQYQINPLFEAIVNRFIYCLGQYRIIHRDLNKPLNFTELFKIFTNNKEIKNTLKNKSQLAVPGRIRNVVDNIEPIIYKTLDSYFSV